MWIKYENKLINTENLTSIVLYYEENMIAFNTGKDCESIKLSGDIHTRLIFDDIRDQLKLKSSMYEIK
jgi:hypothetical protein